MRPDGFHVEYYVPEFVYKQLDLNFCLRFIRELYNVFESNIIDVYMYCTDTIGWSKAFDKACEDTGKKDLQKYCDTLEWSESDVFCDVVTKHCINTVVEHFSKPKRKDGEKNNRTSDTARI